MKEEIAPEHKQQKLKYTQRKSVEEDETSKHVRFSKMTAFLFDRNGAYSDFDYQVNAIFACSQIISSALQNTIPFSMQLNEVQDSCSMNGRTKKIK